jgi:hypothetical protein
MIALSQVLVVCNVLSKTSKPVALIDPPFALRRDADAAPRRLFLL